MRFSRAFEAAVLLLALPALLAAVCVGAEKPDRTTGGGKTPLVYWIPIKDGPQVARGMIDPWMSFFVSRNVRAAQEMKADAIVFAIKSGGGRVDSSMEIAATIRSVKETPTVGYVIDHAFSGAAYVALACEKLYMEPGARMGAAQMVILDPQEGPRPVGEKGDSPNRANFRALAQERGRNHALAEAMADPDKVVLRLEVDAEETFVLEVELSEFERRMTKEGKTVTILDTVIPKGEMLTMTAVDAVERYRFIDGIAEDREALLEAMGLPGARIAENEASWPEEIARFLGGMWMSGLLLSVAMLGLMMELWAPGKGIGGLIFLFGMGLFFWSHFLAGQASTAEIVLFLLGVALLALEAFVIPGFGVAGFTGIGLVVASLVLSFVPGSITSPGIEGLGFPWAALRGAFLTVLAAFGVGVVGLVVLARYVPRAPLFRRLVLAEASGPGTAETGGARAGGLEALVGKRGSAETDLRPAGTVEIEGARVDAVTDAEYLSRGDAVEVLQVSGNRVVVAPARTGGRASEPKGVQGGGTDEEGSA
jgi:membrane-bound serine protease (ClpP class)